jgi:hypothetical protein
MRNTVSMKTATDWKRAIDEACAEPDPAISNRAITNLHYLLSEAMARNLGRDCGPNFHTWAVWGSRKAGVTIRQEDLGSAIRNAMVTAGIVGSLIGAVVGIFAGRMLHWSPEGLNAVLGIVTGGLAGAWTGKGIAIWSREKAARLILEGNRTVLQDIGTQSARFIQFLESGATDEGRATFFAGLRPGATEQRGQDRLATAFRAYLAAFDTDDLNNKRDAMIEGNCAIVYHEHIRLEPYIRKSMPFIVRRCATQRMMTFDIGDRSLSVSEEVPGAQTHSAARNWTNIEERMRYIFALFREFHGAEEIFSAPYPAHNAKSVDVSSPVSSMS